MAYGYAGDHGPFPWTLQTLASAMSARSSLDGMIPTAWIPFAENGAGDQIRPRL